MKDFKIINIFSIILLVFALLSSWFIEYYAFDKRMVTIDQIQHFHDMKKMYESKKLQQIFATSKAVKTIPAKKKRNDLNFNIDPSVKV